MAHKYWIWSWRPEGIDDPRTVNPEAEDPADFWWGSCGRHCKAGDLVALYQAAPVQGITHIFQAVSDAQRSLDSVELGAQKYDYGAFFRPLAVLERALPLTMLRDHSVLGQMAGVRADFRGTQFAVTPAQWRALLAAADEANPGVLSRVRQAPAVPRVFTAGTEKELGDYLVSRRLRDFERVGLRLELADNGRERHALGHGGRIDLYATDTSTGHPVIVELKNRAATEQDVGQLAAYVAWGEWHAEQVTGVLVGQNLTIAGHWALRALPHLRFVSLADLLGRHPAAEASQAVNGDSGLDDEAIIQELDRLRSQLDRIGRDSHQVAAVMGDALEDGLLYDEELHRIVMGMSHLGNFVDKTFAAYDLWLEPFLGPPEPDDATHPF